MKNTTKVIMATTLVMAALAAGCQTTPSVAASASQPITSDALEASNWRLIEARNSNGDIINELFFNPSKPLTLNFMAAEGGNLVSLMNTCNNMGAGYSVVDGELNLTLIRSTMMACPEPLEKFDRAAAATVQGKYSFGKNGDNMPVLTITNDNQVSHFKAVPKTKTP